MTQEQYEKLTYEAYSNPAAGPEAVAVAIELEGKPIADFYAFADGQESDLIVAPGVESTYSQRSSLRQNAMDAITRAGLRPENNPRA